MKPKSRYWQFVAVGFVLALAPAQATPISKPNVVFVLADDLGFTDVGCFGSKYYETPNLDRLAAQGTRFTNFHTCLNCAPTRASLMSGQYSVRTGMYTVGSIARFDWSKRPLRPADNVENLPLDRTLLPQAMKTAGYATGMFGKWHLGEEGDYLPGRRGFDEAIVSIVGAHFDFKTIPKVDYPKGQYLGDFLTDRAVDFIKRHKDHPFFLYLPHYAVHAPHHAKPDLVARFKNKPGVGGHNDPSYAAMIASVDESVGRVMAVLDELKLADNTLLVFMSDNGGVGGYAREGIIAAGDVNATDITDNAPLRSGKGSLYEGGTRVPFIVRWPGQIKAGASCDVPAVHVDLYPTLVACAGGQMPITQIFDGESLVPQMRDVNAKLARAVFYQHFPGYSGAGVDQWRSTPVSVISAGDWKLMEHLEDGRLELYNLRDDLGETKNLATAQPGKTSELRAQLVAWREAVKAPMPTRSTAAAGARNGSQHR